MFTFELFNETFVWYGDAVDWSLAFLLFAVIAGFILTVVKGSK